MTRQDFLKTIGSFFAGIVLARFRNLPGLGKFFNGNAPREARYYKRADHLAG